MNGNGGKRTDARERRRGSGKAVEGAGLQGRLHRNHLGNH